MRKSEQPKARRGTPLCLGLRRNNLWPTAGGLAMVQTNQIPDMKRNLSAVGIVLAAIGFGWIPGLRAAQEPSSHFGSDQAPDGWQSATPRQELRPYFSFTPKGGPDGSGCLVIQ